MRCHYSKLFEVYSFQLHVLRESASHGVYVTFVVSLDSNVSVGGVSRAVFCLLVAKSFLNVLEGLAKGLRFILINR